MDVKLIEVMADDLHVVRAAKVSTEGSNSLVTESNQKLIRYLVRERHASPFEHSVFTFYVHAPIFVTREILRHRWSSLNEESGRYRILEGDFYYPDRERPLQQVGKTGDYQFILAPVLYDELIESFSRAYGVAWEEYQDLLIRGVAKEVARMVLPVGLYSSLYITVNARSLMNFLSLRTADNAQYEIRQVASQMEEHFKQAMPITYDAWVLNGRQAI